MFNIDQIRSDYLYDLFKHNQYLLLNWDRNTGKSKYCLDCIFRYAIEHPRKFILVMSPLQTETENMKNKLLMCHTQQLNFINEINKKSIVLNNGSTIWFHNDKIDHINLFDILFIDDANYIKKNHELFCKLMKNNTIKVIMNSTDVCKIFVNDFTLFLNSIRSKLIIDNYKSDDELFLYSRSKKIENIKSKLNGLLL